MKRPLIAALVLVCLLAPGLPGQATGAQAATVPAVPGAGGPTPGFDVFRLGMSLDELKAALANNAFLIYGGEPDVTMLNRPNTNLIDVPGVSFVSRGIFQVVEGRLYSIALELNPEQLSYFSVYTALVKKYGEPQALDPSQARWESTAVRLSLEKPLTVKYIDMAVFTRLQSEGRAQQAQKALSREKFLEGF